MTETQDLPSQIAFKAADYMAKYGNCKGIQQDADGRVCLEGAVRMAAFGHLRINLGSFTLFQGSAGELWKHLYYLIKLSHPTAAGPVVFNDEIAENGEDVILLLKQAGHDLEEQGR